MTTVLLAQLAAGLDEFTVRMGAVHSRLLAFILASNTWITVAAVVATVITVSSALWQLYKWIHGPGDAGAVILHTARRTANTLGKHATPVRWGSVIDEETRTPLPFARVCILDTGGDVLARAIADEHGFYGFDGIVPGRGGYGMLARKNGYYDHASELPVFAGSYHAPADVPMTRSAAFSEDRINGELLPWQALRTVAFWSGVIAVPLAYAAHPGFPGILMFSLFVAAAVVRATGSSR